MPESTAASSRRLLIALSGLVVALMGVGAVSFVRYVRRNAPNPRLIAVAPVDIFVQGLDAWRVGLADALTRRLDTLTEVDAVPQARVAQTWGSAPRPEISAVELARRTSAGLAVYARVDSLGADSVKVSLIAIDAATTKVLFGVVLHWPAADPGGLAGALAEHVRHNHPLNRANHGAGGGTLRSKSPKLGHASRATAPSAPNVNVIKSLPMTGLRHTA
jgi:hypothetical protein